MPDDLVTVATFGSPVEASLAKNLLALVLAAFSFVIVPLFFNLVL